MERVDGMSVTAEQKKIMESEDTRKIIYVYFPNKELPIIKNNRIYQESMMLQESLLDASDFTFGKCNSSLFQIKVADFEDNIDGAYIDVSIMFENATLGNYEHVLGNYIIASTDRTSDKRFRIISANDYMALFEKDITNWFNNTLFPTDIITNHLGWILEDSKGNKINVTYNKDSAPKTSKIETDDGKYYLDNTTGYVYVGKANYKSNKFVNVTWSKVIECKENVSYTESAETERTINEILQMLCSEVGVEYDNKFPLVNGNLVIKKNFKPETLNAKDLLEQICEANGVFGHFYGKKLCFIAPNKSNPVSEINKYKECDFQDYDVKRINSLQIKTDDEDVGVTVTRENIERINKYTITGNVLFYGITENLEQIAENILSVIENVEYRPNDTTVSNNIDLNVGDCVTVNARISSESGIKSNPFTTIVMQKQISGIQSLFTNISASGNEYQSESQTSLSSQISILDNAQREITRSLTALIADFNQLYANKIDVENLVANVADIDHLDANSAIINTLKSQVITAEYIKSATADLGYLTADSAVITGKLDASQLSAEVAKLGYLTADSAVITGKLDTNQLSAEVAKLGYAKVDFSNVGSQVVDSSMIKDGAVTNEKVANLSANKITSGTIDASKINVTNLNADNLTVGTINGQRIGNGSLSLDKLAEEVPTKEYLDNVEKNLQGQIDGAIETFTKTEIPTLNNEPASAWTDNDTRKKHIGDICYVVNPTSSADGYCYRFADLGTSGSPSYSWVLIKDSDVTKALQEIIDINGEITGIKRFDSEISSWKVDTDSELSSLKTRTTTLETDMGDKVSTNTFNEVKQTVDSNSSAITKMSETVTNVSNTVNEVKQTADSNSSTISSMQTTVGSISKRTTSLEQDLSGFKTTVSNTYSTKGEVSNVSSVASQTADKMSWLVKSGTSASNFELTDRVASLVAHDINVNGRVTFSGLSTDTQSKINKANTTATAAEKTANGIKSNIYTPNTTTINGGKITTESITAKQINVADLFAQDITATGTITGAKLKGAHVEADSGYIGSWGIANGTITNNYEYSAGTESSTDNFTRTTSFGFDGTISIKKNFYNMSAVESFEVSGAVIKLGQGNEWCHLNPQGIYFGYDSTNTSYVSEEGIMENGKMLSEKYLTKFVSVNYTYPSVSVPANGTKSVKPTSTNIPNGYTAIGIKNLNGGSGAVIFRSFALGGTINLINRSSSAVTCTPSMTVVCVKNQFIG